jgi:hypothetical protein
VTRTKIRHDYVPFRVQRACVTEDQNDMPMCHWWAKEDASRRGQCGFLSLSSGAGQCKCQDLGLRIWSAGAGEEMGAGGEQKMDYERNAMECSFGRRV